MNHRNYTYTRSMRIVLALLTLLFPSGSVVVANLVNTQRMFADSLTAELYSNKNSNDCTSALGVSMAFDLIYPSATGQALEDMQKVFGYSPDDQGAEGLQWDDTASRLTGTYNGDCIVADFEDPTKCEFAEPTIEIANSIWVRKGLTLETEYSAVVGEFARSLDFSIATAGEIVNAWVEESTNGLIDSIVEDGPLDPSWILLAINSLYLKAAWIAPFEAKHTNEDNFFPSALRVNGEEMKSHFMHMVGSFAYSDTAVPGYRILKLDFFGGNDSSGISMIFVLPTTDRGDESLSTDVLNALPKLESTTVAIALPKFRFESEYRDTLMAALKAVGLVAPFSGELCITENACDASVDIVIQKTIIDVNEHGIEAAAVTAIAVDRGSAPNVNPPPVEFRCDHTFQFFVYEENEGIVLFEGRVSHPEPPKEGEAAQLQAKHSDADFWKNNFLVEPTTFEIKQTSDHGSTFGGRLHAATLLVALSFFALS